MLPNAGVPKAPSGNVAAASLPPVSSGQERTEPLTEANKANPKAELRRVFRNEIEGCQRVRRTVNATQWRILVAVLLLGTCGPDGDWEGSAYASLRRVPLPDLLIDLGHRESYLREDPDHLFELEYLDSNEDGFRLTGHALALRDFARAVIRRLMKVEGDEEIVAELIEELLPP